MSSPRPTDIVAIAKDKEKEKEKEKEKVLVDAKETKSKQNHVEVFVLDIDETIASRPDEPPHHYTTLLKQYGLILQHEVTFQGRTFNQICYIHPGVKEFLHFIRSLGKFCFFSAGLKCTNQPFIKRLLNETFGEEEYLKNMRDIPIFSREDCDVIKGVYKKNLSKTRSQGENLNKILIIDDNPSISCQGQEKNWLAAPKTHLEHFLSRNEKDLFKSNHIFYITGLLHKALAFTGDNFLDHLQELQKKACENRDIVWQYCVDGLLILRQFNVELDFFNIPLSMAISLKIKNLVVHLVKEQKSIDTPLADNKLTPLLTAVAANNTEMVQLLLEQGANVNACCGSTNALSSAIRNENGTIIEILLKKDAYVNLIDTQDIQTLLSPFINNRLNVLAAFCSHYSLPNMSWEELMRNKLDILLNVLADFFSKIKDTTDIIKAYDNVTHVLGYYPLFRPLIPSVKKVAQMYILSIEFNKETSETLSDKLDKNSPEVKKEHSVVKFMKSTEPFLHKLFSKNHSSYDVYKAIKEKKNTASQMFQDKQETSKNTIEKRLKKLARR